MSIRETPKIEQDRNLCEILVGFHTVMSKTIDEFIASITVSDAEYVLVKACCFNKADLAISILNAFPNINVNAQYHFGVTALTYAKGNNMDDIIKLLMQKGADPNIKGVHEL